jgi:hypothetical protein
MFGVEGFEPVLNIESVGYFGGYSWSGIDFSTYVVHTVNGSVGVHISMVIAESLLDQANPEFYQIMESLEFVE